jgi:hypothetical protein
MSIHQNGPSLLQSMAAAIDLHRQYQRVNKTTDAIPDAIPRSTMTKERRVLSMVNNNRARAPELVLLKRYTPPKEAPMPSNFSTLLRSAISNLEAGRLDDAERLLTKAEKLVDQSTTVHHHHYGNSLDDDEPDDDEENGNYKDTWSEPANGRAKYNNASKAASNNRNGNSLDDEDDDEDDNNNNHVAKSDYHYHVLGGSKTLPEPKDTPMTGGGKGDTYSLGTEPATRAPREHKFDRLVEHVQERDGCSKAQAMSRARQEYPDTFESYQSFLSDSPTSEQHARRAGRGVGKSMPEDYESLVAAEIRKGNPWRVAEQKVVNLHGSSALSNRMIKRNGPSVTAEFAKRADQILWDTPNIDRCEALRRLRKAQPWLYSALNSS